ncbi:hypothetical protein [Holospora curviuscula]|uniref:Uncharacterized protein n=1 Tax=Holospora curviuscula TaxID=1082868 RepID=A0A2S5R7C3_9PROT|nr:hypothetical protein [Holospora curviuscula]PPE03025.1 hypothetical protein HCUR_01535 [Holospora curviuscula]
MRATDALYWLRNLGYRYEEAHEKKCRAYQENIKGISPHPLIYGAESVIEINLCKDKKWGNLIGKKK